MKVAGTVLLTFVLAQNGSDQQQDVRVVNRPPAGWTFNGKPLPEKGPLRLRPGDEIVARGAGQAELGCPNDVVFAYSCRAQTCRARVCELDGEGMDVRRSGVKGLMDWLSAWTSREPSLPVIAAARAGGAPSEAVLVQDGRGIHWAPSLVRVLEGRSCFRLSPLPAVAKATVPFTLDWDRTVDPEGVALVPNISPGLYALEKGTAVSGGCDRDPDAVAAWVLIVPTGDFARLNGEWGEQRKSIAALEQSGLSPVAARHIRQAALAYLARSFPQK
jgi:hypothetical protein